jgi:ferritin-like metal-binding protein YciE
MFSYAFEHMEIAAYRNLVTAARMLGDTKTAQVCEEILKEEIAMADWLEQHMEAVASQFLSRSETSPDAAKR